MLESFDFDCDKYDIDVYTISTELLYLLGALVILVGFLPDIILPLLRSSFVENASIRHLTSYESRLLLFGVARFPGDDAVSPTVLAKHDPQITNKGIWDLPGGKVAALVMLFQKHYRAHGVNPQLGQEDNLPGKARVAKWDVNVALDFEKALRQWEAFAWSAMCVFVINSLGGRGASGREVVDADPSEGLVVCPRVTICPIVQLLVDPCKQAHWAGSDGVASGLGPGALQKIIAETFIAEPSRSFKTGFLPVRQGRSLELGEQRWVRRQTGLGWVAHVDVVRLARFWI